MALGVDYGIFLMHRMREEALNGAEPAAAALTALRTTGGVIASAGLVLAATFAVLTNMPLVSLVEMGFVIAVGVLLDTFLVRTYLVTSASVALQRNIWWPGDSCSRTPHRSRTAEPELVRNAADGAPYPYQEALAACPEPRADASASWRSSTATRMHAPHKTRTDALIARGRRCALRRTRRSTIDQARHARRARLGAADRAASYRSCGGGAAPLLVLLAMIPVLVLYHALDNAHAAPMPAGLDRPLHGGGDRPAAAHAADRDRCHRRSW